MEELIGYEDGRLVVPEHPVIPFIEGDGVGPEIWRATRRVLDAAVERAFGSRRRIVWREVLAGEKAHRETGEWLPEATLRELARCRVAIKGPLATPVGGGIRSLNVAIRKAMDLYACVRPVRWIPGVPSPVRRPEAVDMVIFRENTEDLYAGVEWPAGSPEARRLIAFLRDELGVTLPEEAGIGVKPMSRFASQRLIRRAIRYCLEEGRKSVTMVHKGNIMKYTEGAFREWGYELVPEFEGRVAAEGQALPGQVVLKDRIADNMFQQVLLRPEEYEVLATPNLNGDYLSDALAAQVGGLGMAPGGNISDELAVFEATHGTAPKYAGQDKVNPSSLILSGAMLLRHLGWREAAAAVERGVAGAVAAGTVTYDLARGREGAQVVSTSAFAAAVVDHL